MQFDFASAGRIVFGAGKVRELGTLVCEVLGQGVLRTDRRALIVTGRDASRADVLQAGLTAAGIEGGVVFAVAGEPTVEAAARGAEQARTQGCALVIGIGGGSAIDAAKAIAALAVNPGDPLDYLEVIGRGRAVDRSLPCVAIPTTAGTGSEVTRNAVLASPEHRVKVSLRSPHMLPRLALVDPELTVSMPPEVTVATGLDALTQLIEPFVSHRASPMTDGFCREGIARVSRSLRRAVAVGQDLAPREDMALAGLLGGLALANAGLGAVHGFAGPIGGMYDAPHGAVCAVLLPHVMAANVKALRQREPGHAALERYEEIARIVTGSGNASIDEGVAWVTQLVSDLNVPALGAYGIAPADIQAVVQKATAASSMKANPIALTSGELGGILAAAM